MKSEFKRIVLVAVIFITSFFVFIIQSQAAAVDSDLADTLPQYPSNGRAYWIAFKEGFRNDRVELSTCSISGNKAKAYIEWDDSLTLEGADASGQYNQYKLSESGTWEQIGTYVRFSDHATSIIASNLDVYDSHGKLIMAKTNLRNYPKGYGKTDIGKAKISAVGKQYYTGKKLSHVPG